MHRTAVLHVHLSCTDDHWIGTIKQFYNSVSHLNTGIREREMHAHIFERMQTTLTATEDK